MSEMGVNDGEPRPRAMVFTDAAGYSAITSQDEDKALRTQSYWNTLSLLYLCPRITDESTPSQSSKTDA